MPHVRALLHSFVAPTRAWSPMVAVGIAYYILGRLALLTALPPGYATAAWPAAGVATAAALHLGHRACVPVAIAAFALSYSVPAETGSTWLCAAVVIAAASGAQVLFVRFLVLAFDVLDSDLVEPRDILLFLLAVGPLGCLLSAMTSVAALFLLGIIDATQLPLQGLSWWAGDTLGSVLVCPVLLMWLLPRRRKQSSRKGTLAVVLLGTLVVGVTAQQLARVADERTDALRFNGEAHGLINGVLADLASSQASIESIVHTFEVFGVLPVHQFSELARATLRAHPGLDALSWNPLISNTERGAAEHELQLIYGARKPLIEKASKGFREAQDRPIHVYVHLIEPLAGNEAAVGYDVYSNPMRRGAIDRAIRTGASTMTTRVALVQSRENGYGHLSFSPYLAPGSRPGELRVRGFIAAVYRVDLLVAAVRTSHPGFDLQIIDRSDSDQPTVVYSSSTRVPAGDEPVLTQRAVVGGRDWEFQVTRSERMLVAAPTLVLATTLGGVMVAFLIALVTVGWSGHAVALEGAVAQRTSELSHSNQELDRTLSAHLATLAELEASEKRYKQLIGAAGAAIALTDVNGRIVEWNLEAERIFGTPRSEALGRRFTELVGSKDQQARIATALWSAASGCPVRDVELERVHDHGTHSTDSWNFDSIASTDSEARGVICAGTDVTEHRRAEREHRALERQLVHAQQMEALGSLAGGMAHDFNNILASILGFAELLLFDGSLGSKARGDLESITTAVQRGREITDRIRRLSHREEAATGGADVVQLVTDIARLLRGALPSTIEIIEECDIAAAPIDASPVELFQVLLNVATNAYQAMPRGGTLRLSVNAEPGPGAERSGGDALATPAPSFRIRIADTGVGMDDEVQKRIFEPYFTTKPVGHGTGLGLASAYTVVGLAGGTISVDSTVGEGTVFTIILPRASAADGVPESTPELGPLGLEACPDSEATPGCGGEQLLIVDDEPSVARATAGLLELKGYAVTVSNSPSEALSLLGDPTRTIDLVLTDLDLPELSGIDLAPLIHNLRPHLPILVWTGHGRDLTDEAESAHIIEVLHKPVELDALIVSIRAALRTVGGAK